MFGYPSGSPVALLGETRHLLYLGRPQDRSGSPRPHWLTVTDISGMELNFSSARLLNSHSTILAVEKCSAGRSQYGSQYCSSDCQDRCSYDAPNGNSWDCCTSFRHATAKIVHPVFVLSPNSPVKTSLL